MTTTVYIRTFSLIEGKPAPRAYIRVEANLLLYPPFMEMEWEGYKREDEIKRWLQTYDKECVFSRCLMRALHSIKKYIKKGHKRITVDVGCVTGRRQAPFFANCLRDEIHEKEKEPESVFEGVHVKLFNEAFPNGDSEDHDAPFETLDEEERKEVPREFLGRFPSSPTLKGM